MQARRKPTPNKPLLIVTMGVSGCGKSTQAAMLAEKFGFKYLDGDDYHCTKAKERMASGIPLTDDMRKPWVTSITGHLKQLSCLNQNCCLAFSGLRKAHRDAIRSTGFDVVFLFLSGDKATIRKRITRRNGHFMPAKLLDSQFESLEWPTGEDKVFTVDVSPSLDIVTKRVLNIASYQLAEYNGV